MELKLIKNNEELIIQEYASNLIALVDDGEICLNTGELIDNLLKDNYVQGSYAAAIKENNQVILTRDPVGSQKIFYFISKKDNTIFISNNFIDLSQKVSLDYIRSVERGTVISINSNKEIKKMMKKSKHIKSDIRTIRHQLKKYISGINKKNYDRVFVCLSGGLDSSIIASLSKEMNSQINLITGVLMNNDEVSKFNNSGKYDIEKFFDCFNSEKIARELNLNHEIVPILKKKITQNIKEIMYACQDWRDYNVHCATLNFYLAKYIHENNPKGKVAVITGDFMNEVFADYTSEYINNIEYYKQPQTSQLARQRFFVKGLDTSDREVGIFNYYGIDCYQPYSSVIENYCIIGEKLFTNEPAKYHFNSKLINNKLLKCVGNKKTRAQSGDTDGGILGHYINNNYDQKELERLFCKFFNFNKKSLSDFIQIGSYRV